MKKTVMTTLLLAGVAGCAVTQNADPHRYAFQRNEYAVGGGFAINYTATEDGTLVCIDEATQQVLWTESLKAGESSTRMAGSSPEGMKELLGNDLTKVRLVAYFVPDSVKLKNTNPKGK